MTNKIEISTLNISVKVLMLDNKRFTKSIFNQLPEYSTNWLASHWNEESKMKLFVEKAQIIGFVRNVNENDYLLIDDKGTLAIIPLYSSLFVDKNLVENYEKLKEFIFKNYPQIFI